MIQIIKNRRKNSLIIQSQHNVFHQYKTDREALT